MQMRGHTIILYFNGTCTLCAYARANINIFHSSIPRYAWKHNVEWKYGKHQYYWNGMPLLDDGTITKILSRPSPHLQSWNKLIVTKCVARTFRKHISLAHFHTKFKLSVLTLHDIWRTMGLGRAGVWIIHLNAQSFFN
jgi:hypothetical protein